MFLRQLTGLKNILALLFVDAEPGIKILNSIQLRGQGPKFFRTDDDGDHWGNTSADYEQQFVSVILDSVFFPDNYNSED